MAEIGIIYNKLLDRKAFCIKREINKHILSDSGIFNDIEQLK